MKRLALEFIYVAFGDGCSRNWEQQAFVWFSFFLSVERVIYVEFVSGQPRGAFRCSTQTEMKDLYFFFFKLTGLFTIHIGWCWNTLVHWICPLSFRWLVYVVDWISVVRFLTSVANLRCWMYNYSTIKSAAWLFKNVIVEKLKATRLFQYLWAKTGVW